MLKTRRGILLLLALLAAIGGATLWMAARSRRSSVDFDAAFRNLHAGMTPTEVEEILGSPTGEADHDTMMRIVGFSAVDSLPFAKYDPRLIERIWWHDGRDRCIYVEYSSGKLLRAKLFGSGPEKSIGVRN